MTDGFRVDSGVTGSERAALDEIIVIHYFLEGTALQVLNSCRHNIFSLY